MMESVVFMNCCSGLTSSGKQSEINETMKQYRSVQELLANIFSLSALHHAMGAPLPWRYHSRALIHTAILPG